MAIYLKEIKMENREHLRKHCLLFCISLDKENVCDLFLSSDVTYTEVPLTVVIFFDLGKTTVSIIRKCMTNDC